MDAEIQSPSLLREILTEPDLTSSSRAYLQRGRGLLLDRHRAGASGGEIVSAYTAMMDQLIIHLFDAASRDYILHYPGLNLRCALVAQGGYGRRELNPNSDIDLLFLYAWKVSPYVESVAEKVLYTLWDCGLEVGHATRSVTESLRLAAKDIRVKTALMDGRYLCGDRALYQDFEKAVEENLLKKNESRFIREKMAEHRLRHERYGGSVYLLEPDLKEGEGGLRDIHTALWIARVKYGVKEMDSLVDFGLLSGKDLAELKEARDFLWRVRNELHLNSGKHQDQLTFEEQEKVAVALGYQRQGAIKAVEAFMRSYYLRASQVSRMTALVIHRSTESWDPTHLKSRLFGREVREGLRLLRGTLLVTDPGMVDRQPENLVTIFVEAQRHRAELAHAARELLRDRLSLIDDRFRRAPSVNAGLFQILKWKERVYETLSEMHRSGVLGALIPEFGRLLCMALHDLYHIYTVDQHSLRLVRELERLKAGEFKETLPLLTQLAREREKTEILYLGCLFHDIGKGLGGGHSEIGCKMARNIARRMRLTVDDAAQLDFLVRHHLLMANTAFRRDIEDEKLVRDFALSMGNGENLKMLYLLTYADMRAVGPDVWNNWKGSLLEQLYIQALRVLEGAEKGELLPEDRRSKIRRVQARLRRHLLKNYSTEKIAHFVNFMPERYFLTTPEEEIPLHFELMGQFAPGSSSGQAYLSAVRHFPDREYSEMVICAEDRPGLFAQITGVFAALGLDILSARINTRGDGVILDVFRISHAGRPEVVMDPQKWIRVQETLEKVLSGTVEVACLVEKSGRQSLFKKRAPKVPTVIQIDNAAAEDFTIVEVYTQDRIGVLFSITYALRQLGLSIHLAKISTNVDQVADVFYVTGEGGAKILEEDLLEKIRTTLYGSLITEDGSAFQRLP